MENVCAARITAGEKADERYKKVLPLFIQLREEIGHDMGVCMADRLAEWQEEYL